jgi:hypothetical protein
MKKGMAVSYLGQFAASLLMFYMVAGLIVGFGHNTLEGGVTTGFLVWLGFVLPIKLGDLIWGGKKNLFWINIGNMLVTLLIVGAILGSWK